MARHMAGQDAPGVACALWRAQRGGTRLMPLPVDDEVCSAGLDGRLSALGERLHLLLESRLSDEAARVLFRELGELPLSVVAASADRLMDPVLAAGLTRATNALQCELRDA